MKVEIKNIEIAIKDKKIVLTVEEARELQKQLNDLFGASTTYVSTYPVYIERETWPWWKHPYYTTCDTVSRTYTKLDHQPHNDVTVYCLTEESVQQ